jgi:hypothetical protein
MQLAMSPLQSSLPTTTRTFALPYVCSECAAHRGEPGECACGGGPLLDLRDPAIQEALRDDDQRRADRAKQRNIWIGVAVGILGGGALLWVGYPVILAIPLPIPFANPVKVIALMIAITACAVFALDRAIPAKARFPELKL